MVNKFRLGSVLGVAGLIAGLGFCAKPASAQSFSSFISVTEQSGLLLKLNGVDVTNLNVIGTNGTYRTGYETSGTAMVLKFTADASGFAYDRYRLSKPCQVMVHCLRLTARDFQHFSVGASANHSARGPASTQMHQAISRAKTVMIAAFA